MLKDILQSKESKIQEKIEAHLKKGVEQLKQKMYNGAMVEFGKAMELDFESVYPKLLKELENAASGGELEAALAVGLNMLKHKKDDFKLANKLGNYARRNKDFKQAKALYQTALKIKKNYSLAFYNLAAAEIKAELYDDMAVNAVNQFKTVQGYILPGYVNDENPVELLSENAKKTKLKLVNEKIRKLTHKRNQENESGNTSQVRLLDQEMAKLKKATEQVSPQDICMEFKRLSKSDASNRKIHCFNLSVFALENSKSEIAEEALGQLNDKEFPTKGLLQAIALDQKGKREEAIDQLVQFLGENELNRYYNVNLGLIYRKSKNNFLASKYLIKTAELLKKSNGLYNMHELIKEADQNYEQGNMKKALEFYRIVSSEILEPNIWLKMGLIHKEQEQLEEAIKAFKEVLRLDPDSAEGKSQLQEMHDSFISNGDALMEKKKINPAVEQYEKALSVFRLPETLKKASSGYRQLNSIKRSNQLLEECESMLNAEKEKEQEKLRTALIIKAKMMLKQQKYQVAIEFLETAFAMKLDKNIYAQLTMLYKKFKGQDSLSGLEKRWNDMIIAKERAETEAREKLKGRESIEQKGQESKEQEET